MPGNVSEPSGVPARGDSEQEIKDMLAQLVNGQAVIAAAIAELAEKLGQESQAARILRQAQSEGKAQPEGKAQHRAIRRGNKAKKRASSGTDTFLRVVRVALVAFLGLAAVLALMAPKHIRDQQFSPQRSAQVAHMDSDGGYDGTP